MGAGQADKWCSVVARECRLRCHRRLSLRVSCGRSAGHRSRCVELQYAQLLPSPLFDCNIRTSVVEHVSGTSGSGGSPTTAQLLVIRRPVQVRTDVLQGDRLIHFAHTVMVALNPAMTATVPVAPLDSTAIGGAAAGQLAADDPGAAERDSLADDLGRSAPRTPCRPSLTGGHGCHRRLIMRAKAVCSNKWSITAGIGKSVASGRLHCRLTSQPRRTNSRWPHCTSCLRSQQHNNTQQYPALLMALPSSLTTRMYAPLLPLLCWCCMGADVETILLRCARTWCGGRRPHVPERSAMQATAGLATGGTLALPSAAPRRRCLIRKRAGTSPVKAVVREAVMERQVYFQSGD